MTVDITVPVTPQQVAAHQDILSNWLRLHSYCKMLPDSEASLKKLQVLISVELRTRKRVQIITRLRSKFGAMRKRLEDQAMFRKVPELAKA